MSKSWVSIYDKWDFDSDEITVVVSKKKSLGLSSILPKGGVGSGNFGHSGRPGQVGGSGGGGGITQSDQSAEAQGNDSTSTVGVSEVLKRITTKPFSGVPSEKEIMDRGEEFVSALDKEMAPIISKYAAEKQAASDRRDQIKKVYDEWKNGAGKNAPRKEYEKRWAINKAADNDYYEARSALPDEFKSKVLSSFSGGDGKPIDVITGKITSTQEKALDDGRMFFRNTLGSMDLPHFQVTTLSEEDSSLGVGAAMDSWKRMMYLKKKGSDVRGRIIVHELGHYIETRVPGVMGITQQHLKKRTAGEPSQSIPGMKSAVAKPDKFIKPYMGRLYPNKDLGTEILSVGLESMKMRTFDFYKDDKESFKFITGMMSYLSQQGKK